MTEKIRPRSVQPSSLSRRPVHPSPPVAIRRVRPRLPFSAGKDERACARAATRTPPLRDVGRKGRQQADSARLTCLRLLRLAERDRLYNKDRSLPDVSPLKRESFTRAKSSVGEYAY